jgi:hypothetical protein
MRPERAMVRHWQLVMLASTFSWLVGALPEGTVAIAVGPEPDAPAAAAETPAHVSAGEKIRPTAHRRQVRGAGRVERDAAPGAGVVVPVGTAAARLETLVDRRPTARVGRAPRPRRPLPST